LVRWPCYASTRDFLPALAALVGPEQNIFFLSVHYFNSFITIAQQARQAVVLGSLSLIMLCSSDGEMAGVDPRDRGGGPPSLAPSYILSVGRRPTHGPQMVLPTEHVLHRLKRKQNLPHK
jgi:hypothetical protein